MKREIIWNTSLLLFAILLVLAFTINTTTNLSMMVWRDSLFPPVGLENKIKLGLIIGVIFIVFRYIIMGILSISNKDLRLLVMMIAYSFPILLVRFALHLYIDSELDTFPENVFPLEQMEKEIKELRTAGVFKAYADKSDKFVTELAVGRAISKDYGSANSSMYWDMETNKIDKLELLRLDTEKVWKGDDTEFVVEGNRVYEDVIKELGEISEGHFLPNDINEDWVSKEQINLSFKIADKEHVIQPLVRNDWADMSGILKYLNNEILDTVDYQFYYGVGGDIMIIGLEADERVELGNLTGIEFREIK